MNNDEKPAFRLATIVVDRLINNGLLRPGQRNALIQKISQGQMKEYDWDLEIDRAISKDNQS